MNLSVDSLHARTVNGVEPFLAVARPSPTFTVATATGATVIVAPSSRLLSEDRSGITIVVDLRLTFIATSTSAVFSITCPLGFFHDTAVANKTPFSVITATAAGPAGLVSAPMLVAPSSSLGVTTLAVTFPGLTGGQGYSVTASGIVRAR
jgi:hypothetical protein